VDFNLTSAEEAFRAEVRAFLDEMLPPGTNQSDPRWIGEWLRRVREKRWVGFSWPKEVGGGGGSLMEQVILKEEMAKRKAPPLGSCFMGLAWVGPAIIQYGTEAQKQRFIPDILDGTEPVVHRLLGAQHRQRPRRAEDARRAGSVRTSRMIHFDHIAIEVQIFWPFTT